jgi:predicted dehydrogenase
MPEIPMPATPVSVALIGTGARSRTIYRPVCKSVAPWMNIVAVCDPVRENCDAMATELGVPAYYDIHQLVKDQPMEAALIVTPVESHYPISVYLSSHGIHNMAETTWCSMVCQAQEMIRVAREQQVIVRVAENFFRYSIDRFAHTVRDSGYLGRIRRIFSYADHTGYHNNSRWIAFAQAHPTAVQCIEHTIDHPAFYSSPERRHESETQTSRFFFFPDNFLVTDTGSGHVKGHLGRHPRPGYTEWQGERGTLMHRAPGSGWADCYHTETELRRLSDAKLAPAQETANYFWNAAADEITPVQMEWQDHQWIRTVAETPQGVIAYDNPFRLHELCQHMNDDYCVPILGHLVDFVLAVRGLQASEFTDEDALASLMMEVGARESALRDGRRIALPLDGDLESDAITRQRLRAKYGVDPLDIEGMLAISYPKP